MTMLQVSTTGLILTKIEKSEYFGIKTEISEIRGKLAITKSAENCFPWGEVMDSKIGYFYGRQTTSFIKRYRFVFGASEISRNHCH